MNQKIELKICGKNKTEITNLQNLMNFSCVTVAFCLTKNVVKYHYVSLNSVKYLLILLNWQHIFHKHFLNFDGGYEKGHFWA